MSCAERTGCDYDYTWVWTLNECTVPAGYPGAGQIGHIAMPGDQRKWQRREVGDCKMRNPVTHKACVKGGGSAGSPATAVNVDGGNNQQGMMNKGAQEPYRIAWPGFPSRWYAGEGKRASYLSAMKELFQWKSGRWYDDSKVDSAWSENGAKQAHNPLLDTTYGKVCIPDDGEGTLESEVADGLFRKGVFVRCCGDHGWDCLKCPEGYTNGPGNGKDIYVHERWHCRRVRCLELSIFRNGRTLYIKK